MVLILLAQGISNPNYNIAAESHYEDQQQQVVNQPTVNVSTDVSSVSTDQVLEVIRTANSSHSISSFDSTADLSTYVSDR